MVDKKKQRTTAAVGGVLRTTYYSSTSTVYSTTSSQQHQHGASLHPCVAGWCVGVLRIARPLYYRKREILLKFKEARFDGNGSVTQVLRSSMLFIIRVLNPSHKNKVKEVMNKVCLN